MIVVKGQQQTAVFAGLITQHSFFCHLWIRGLSISGDDIFISVPVYHQSAGKNHIRAGVIQIAVVDVQSSDDSFSMGISSRAVLMTETDSF